MLELPTEIWELLRLLFKQKLLNSYILSNLTLLTKAQQIDKIASSNSIKICKYEQENFMVFQLWRLCWKEYFKNDHLILSSYLLG